MPDYVRVATGGASSALNQNNGYCPVFISETHNYYYLRRNFGGGSLNMMKTSDPRTVSWTEQDAAGNPGEGANVGSAKCFRHPDSQIIHVIYQYTIIGPTDDEYRYAQFNMATDNWDIANETAFAFDPADMSSVQGFDLYVRSDGDVVLLVNGLTDANMGDEKDRVDIYVRTASWSGATAVDAGGDVHYGNPVCELAPNDDDGLLVFQRQTSTADDPPIAWSDVQARHNTSADSLGTVVTDTEDTQDMLYGLWNCRSWLDAGTERYVVWGVNDDGVTREIHSVHLTTSGTTVTFQSNQTHNQTNVGGSLPRLSADIDSRGFSQIVISDFTDLDIYYMRSEDNGDSATLDEDREYEDAVSAQSVHARIIEYRAAEVLGYIYHDGGVDYFNHIELYPWEPSWRDIPYTVVLEKK